MTLTDFVFRGDRLSDLECMVAYMVTTPSESTSMGSTMTHETLYVNSTYKSKKLHAKYEEPITATFDIFKNECHANELAYFNDKECSHIMKWLGSKTSQKFIPIYDDTSYPGLYYMGTFDQIDAIICDGLIIGFTITFNAESPWGYAAPRTITRTGTTNNWNFIVNCDSDDEGYLYPDKTIIKFGNIGTANFSMIQTNSEFDTNSVTIKNCVSGEELTLNGEYKIITSNKTHDKLYNDFNYNFPRLFNDYRNTKNTFTVSIPCSITMTYSPVRKVGIIV